MLSNISTICIISQSSVSPVTKRWSDHEWSCPVKPFCPLWKFKRSPHPPAKIPQSRSKSNGGPAVVQMQACGYRKTLKWIARPAKPQDNYTENVLVTVRSRKSWAPAKILDLSRKLLCNLSNLNLDLINRKPILPMPTQCPDLNQATIPGEIPECVATIFHNLGC